MRKSIILAAFLVVALVAGDSFAAVQSVKVKGAVNSMGVFRENFNLTGTATDDQQFVGITQATVEIQADLTDQVQAVIGMINERAWEVNPGSANSDIDLHKAFIVLREFLYSPATLMIGRFTGDEWWYGNSFIFNAGGTNNSAPGDSGISAVAGDLTKQTGLDAVRLLLDYNPLTVEAFVGVVDHTTVKFSDADDDKILYGLYNTYEVGDDMNSVVELYFFGLIDKSETAGSIDNQKDKIVIFGTRASTNPFEGLNIQGEIAHQGGTQITTNEARQRDAWGVQGIVNYQIPALQEYNPVFTYAFTKVYGDKAGAADDEYTAWDPFFESQGGGKIYNALFNLSNAVIHQAELQFNPMEDVTAKLTYAKLWTHQKLTATTLTLVQPDGDTPTTETNVGSREIGQEVDIDLLYDYTEDVQFGLSIGVFKPSDIFIDDVNAKQVIANVNVAF